MEGEEREVVGILLDPDLKALEAFEPFADDSLQQLVRREKLTAGKALRVPLAGPKREIWLASPMGQKDEVTEGGWISSVKALAAALSRTDSKHIRILVARKARGTLNEAWCLEQLAQHCEQACYRYRTTRSEKKDQDKDTNNCRWKTAQFDWEAPQPDTAKLQEALQRGQACGFGSNVACELGNLPGNYCTPSWLSKTVHWLAQDWANVKVETLGPDKLASLGMGSLLSVGRGSKEPCQLIVVEYHGGKSGEEPISIVGKGITFDTGGISLKPGGGMDQMKFDMGGAASVVGTLAAVVHSGLPVNLIGVIAAAENMPDACATKPGDVVTAMDGTTIEVLNTDAEGRLVLCDALCYVKKYNPQIVVDVATLTGACVVALGHEASAIYSRDDELAQALLEAGETSGDRGWRMPLWDSYGKGLKSNFADIANIGGRDAGSAVAASFLEHFVKGYKWAHMDIAGTAWSPSAPKAATGRPVPLLFRFLRDSGDITN